MKRKHVCVHEWVKRYGSSEILICTGDHPIDVLTLVSKGPAPPSVPARIVPANWFVAHIGSSREVDDSDHWLSAQTVTQTAKLLGLRAKSPR